MCRPTVCGCLGTNRKKCRHLVTTGSRSRRAAPLPGPGRDRHGLPRRAALLRRASCECAMTWSRCAGGHGWAFRFDRGLSRWLIDTQHDARSEFQAIPYRACRSIHGTNPAGPKSPGCTCDGFWSRTGPGIQVARSYRQSERTSRRVSEIVPLAAIGRFHLRWDRRMRRTA